MRPRLTFALFGSASMALLILGCRRARYVAPESPLPPNTVLLSQMLREQPAFTETLLASLDKGGKPHGGKAGPVLLTPRLVDDLRNRIFGKDWSGLDRYPGWTMAEINPTVRVAGHYAGKDEKLEDASAVHPGAPLNTAQASDKYLDLGPYALDKAETVSLDKPSTLPGFTTEGIVTELGAGITRGDGPNALAAEHSESQRLADILNRLAANKLDGAEPFKATLSGVAHPSPSSGEGRGASAAVSDPSHAPEDLIGALAASGHTVTVTDSRYFANFTHLHANGQDVMAPFWVNSRIVIPHSGGRPLLIPVSHAELEWHIRPAAGARGLQINADVAYYFGVDGKSEWRTMDTLDQAWVLKRDAHTYTGADAVEATRLAGLLTVAYMRLHAAYPQLPFGGYYAFGVCQDGVSAIEQKMTGHVTLFPNTADDKFFNDPRDAEVNTLMAAIPKDRDGAAPTPDRIFGSLPTTPDNDFAAITIPGLSADLSTTYSAWRDGKLAATRPRRTYAFIALVLAVATLLLLRRRRAS